MDKGKIHVANCLYFFKVIDSLNHKMISKLSYYGVESVALKLLKSYLTDRQQFVHM